MGLDSSILHSFWSQQVMKRSFYRKKDLKTHFHTWTQIIADTSPPIKFVNFWMIKKKPQNRSRKYLRKWTIMAMERFLKKSFWRCC